MDLGECPYCNMLGLVTHIKSTPNGFEVTAQCLVCGYGYDSDYARAEFADDLPYEFSLPVEQEARD
jgi:transcription elongation factor Elf1